MKGFRKIIALTFAALTVIYAAGCTDTATSSVREQSGGDNQSADQVTDILFTVSSTFTAECI